MNTHRLVCLLALACLPAAVLAETPPPDNLSHPDVLIRGNNQVVAPPAPPAPLQGRSSNFRFDDTPLAQVVHVILREVAQLDYIIHPPLNGALTLVTQRPVNVDQALQLLESALLANGYLMARDSRGVYHIGRPDVIRTVVPAIRVAQVGQPLPPGHGAVVLPLEFIGAAEMASILRPLAPPDALVRVDTLRNLLIMVGTRNQIEGWRDLVSVFDVNLLQGMSVGVFALQHITTREVETALRLFTLGSGASAASTLSATPSASIPAITPGAASAGAGGASAAGGGAPASRAAAAGVIAPHPLDGAFRIVPIERTNSLLIITPRAAYLEEIQYWLRQLDRPGSSANEPQLFVYAVQNGNARHLAGVLSGLFGAGQPAAPTAATVAPGLQAIDASAGGASQASAGTPAAGQPNNPVSSASLIQMGRGGAGQESVRIMPDELNNAVLVYATPGEFARIEATLKRLDVSPAQVMIEASIIEVTLNDELRYGLQWLFSNDRGTSILSTQPGGVLGGALAGFSYTLRSSAGGVRAVLNALAEQSLLRVISSPSLMVLDNHTASISVGNQQPVRVGETVTAGGNVTTNIQFRDTGVNLSVTPSVNAGNMVTMTLNQNVTDVGQVDTATGQRTFLQRQIDTRVAVRSGETLVLGGLIRENNSRNSAGVPLLHEIPVLGGLFGSRTNTADRTELLVVITPRVLRTEEDMQELTHHMRSRMNAVFDGLPALRAEPPAAAEPATSQPTTSEPTETPTQP